VLNKFLAKFEPNINVMLFNSLYFRKFLSVKIPDINPPFTLNKECHAYVSMLYLDGLYAEDNYGKTRLDEANHRF
jgi:hypothetical protein